MRTPTAILLIAAMMLATLFDEVLLFGAARHLFAARPAPGVNVALAPPVREAEAAEWRACLVLRPLDLYDPRTSCEAR